MVEVVIVMGMMMVVKAGSSELSSRHDLNFGSAVFSRVLASLIFYRRSRDFCNIRVVHNFYKLLRFLWLWYRNVSFLILNRIM